MRNKYTLEEVIEKTIIEILTDENGKKTVHYLAYGYYSESDSNKPYRLLEYTFLTAPLEKAIDMEIQEYESKFGPEVKQYITDCTEQELLECYRNYNNSGDLITIIKPEDITMDIPDGFYIYQNFSRFWKCCMAWNGQTDNRKGEKQMKIGVTERGDASIDFSWVKKMDGVNGAILITKNITDKFIEKALFFKNKTIIHATCTGYGGTILEPNVPTYDIQLKHAHALVEDGFPINRIVIRVDPIIPTEKGIRTAQRVIKDAYTLYGFRRFRISIIDMYKHVRERFTEATLPLPYGNDMFAHDEHFATVDKMVHELKDSFKDIRIECCAEPKLTEPIRLGCISEYDAELLGFSKKDLDLNINNRRQGCLCLPCKMELLNTCHQCPHKCMYCYWKDQVCIIVKQIFINDNEKTRLFVSEIEHNTQV